MAAEPITHPPSTNVGPVTYDKDTQTLVIQFLSGYSYVYHDVDEGVALGFGQALNANQYFRTYIMNSYQYERL